MVTVGSIVIRVDDLDLQRQFWMAALDYVPRQEQSDDFALLRAQLRLVVAIHGHRPLDGGGHRALATGPQTDDSPGPGARWEVSTGFERLLGGRQPLYAADLAPMHEGLK